MWWRFLIVLFSFILIGAHFLRSGDYIITIISCLSPLLLFVKIKGVYTALEYILYLLSFTVWGWSAFNFIMTRMSHGEPWHRLLIIMFAVFSYTVYSGFCVKQLNRKLSI